MLTLSSDSRHTVNGTNSESFVSVLQELLTTKYIKLWSFPITKSKSNKGRRVQNQNIKIYDMEYALLPDLIRFDLMRC